MVYKGNGNQSTDYNTSKQYKGNAVYEISRSGIDTSGSWFAECASFPSSSKPFFHHGGHFNNGGVFYFGSITGAADGGASFHIVLAP